MPERLLSHLASWGLHVGLLAWLVWSPWAGAPLDEPPAGRLVQILVPAGGRNPPAPASPQGIGPPQARGTEAPGDLRGLQIRIEPDPEHEMIAVLIRYSGRVGVAGRAVPRALWKLCEPDTGRCQQVAEPLDRWLAVRVWEPETWPELSAALEPHSAGEVVIYGLFPLRFQVVLLDEIRREAARRAWPGPVRWAAIAFAARSPSGIRVTALGGDPPLRHEH